MRTIILFLFLSISSCNNISNTDKLPNPAVPKDNFDEILTKNMQNKPKIFLKFWSGMTYEEYFAVCRILEKEGVIKDGYYQYSKVDCILKDNIVIAIVLNNIQTDLYKLYQQKYSLPALIKKSTITANFVENNPEYNPSMTYTNDDNVATLLPICFKDNSVGILDNRKMNLISNFESNGEFMVDSEYIINNDSVYIKIEQKILPNHMPQYKYSLEENKDIERYMNSAQGKEVFGTNFMGGINGSCIERNSKLRYVTEFSHPYITITYMSKKEYLRLSNKEKLEKNSLGDDKLKKEVEQKRILKDI